MKPEPLHCAIILMCLTLAPRFSFAAEFETKPFNKNDGFPGIGNKDVWLKARAYFRKANQTRRAGKAEDSIKLYREAISLYPHDPAFFSNFALGLADTGKYSEAERMVREALRLNPSKLNTKVLLVKILLLQKRTAAAKTLFHATYVEHKSTTERQCLDKTRIEIKSELGIDI